jgi:hypothetical protein
MKSRCVCNSLAFNSALSNCLKIFVWLKSIYSAFLLAIKLQSVRLCQQKLCRNLRSQEFQNCCHEIFVGEKGNLLTISLPINYFTTRLISNRDISAILIAISIILTAILLKKIQFHEKKYLVAKTPNNVTFFSKTIFRKGYNVESYFVRIQKKTTKK